MDIRGNKNRLLVHHTYCSTATSTFDIYGPFELNNCTYWLNCRDRIHNKNTHNNK